MSNEEKDIFNSLGEKLDQQQFEFNPDHWSDMESRLDNEPVPEPAGGKRRRGLLWISFAGLLGALFLSLFQWVRHDDVAVNDTPKAEKNIAVLNKNQQVESPKATSTQESQSDEQTLDENTANTDEQLPDAVSAEDADATSEETGQETESTRNHVAVAVPPVNMDDERNSASPERQGASTGHEDHVNEAQPPVNGAGLAVLPVVSNVSKEKLKSDMEGDDRHASGSESDQSSGSSSDASENQDVKEADLPASALPVHNPVNENMSGDLVMGTLPVTTNTEVANETKEGKSGSEQATDREEGKVVPANGEQTPEEEVVSIGKGAMVLPAVNMRIEMEEVEQKPFKDLQKNPFCDEDKEALAAVTDSMEVPEDSLVEADELSADSSLAKEEKDSDDPVLWSALRLYGGVNLLKGYTNDAETQALERNGVAANAHVGLLFARDLTEKIGTLGGISYYQRSRLNYTRSIVNVKYDFGRTEERVTISTDKLHFIRFSLGGYYTITDRLSLNAMASADRLLTVRNNITTEADGATQETKDYGYANGYKTFSYALNGGAQYQLTDRLNLGALYTQGLTNIMTTGNASPSSGSENSGVQLYLTYDVVKRKKENHE